MYSEQRQHPWHLWTLAAAATVLVAACGGGGDNTVLGVAGAIDRSANYSVADLQARPAVTQTVSFSSGIGAQTHIYTGTNTWTLLDSLGIQTDAARKNDLVGRYVLATAKDGYKVVFSLAELHPDFGNKQSLLAYAETQGGASTLLGATDGPVRITAPGDIKGGRYVSGVMRLDVRASAATAAASGGGLSTTVDVSGAVSKPTTFDLAALQALPATTQTIAGSVYTGVSLWTLLNTTAGLKYDAATKNATLAMYAVATSTDGYRALVSLGEIDPAFGNRTALVAYSVNGAPLDRNGMARLVVPGDTKLARAVSNLKSIEVFAAEASK